ncbi:uncharacterized protein I303_106079 [Kwoniella dejecticola CBS 10117]|uniref:RRM domain-containing protein n=1 Tax=Kwoniella dejecticola CBS 10117 TaxID=1296121 RepID=A0A1A6A178_9TREE|nr:uncharacterized protein I303_06099 [Kwoniella dejecticola CBS 10117]OBR83816.1 hypothetical protein I303_06099 [Kwoniella dejecticola CBS 10117]
MPKSAATDRLVPSSKPNHLKRKSTENVQQSTASSSSRGQPRLYSSFLPIPLILPTSLPIASSSSSKAITSVRHYIYARPHTAKPSLSGSSNDLPEGRTLFVTNLPIDAGVQDLRSIFGKWGVVEDVRIGASDVNVLEQAVKGLPVEESDNEDDKSAAGDDEEGSEQDENEEEGQEDEGKAEPRFQGDIPVRLTKNQRRNARKRAKNALPPSVPEIIPLPSLNPRSTEMGHSGSRSCHVIFLDGISITRLMSSSAETITLKNYPSEPVGLDYYTRLHQSLRPDWESVKDYADSSMARFDHLHGLLLSSRAKQQGSGALVDEDGFTVVVRSGRYGRAGARGDGFGKGGVGVASTGFAKKMQDKKKGKGAGELKDFYKFQRNERKRQELADLRSKFESDKQKVEELKKSRRFKPY